MTEAMAALGTAPAVEGEREDMRGQGLFEGDAGTLSLEQRRVLTALLKRPCVSDAADPKLYAVVERDEDLLAGRLNDLGLQLHRSSRYRVAWVEQVDLGDDGPFRLKSAQPLRRDATLLVVWLRAYQHEHEAHGEQEWYVEREDLKQALADGPYRDERDASRLERALKSTLEQLERLGYITESRRQDGYYRIMPILPAAFTLERARQILADLRGAVAAANVQGGALDAAGDADAVRGEG